jgi:hypothetical protein
MVTMSCQYLPCCFVNKDKSVRESSTQFDRWVSDSRWGTQWRCRTWNPNDCVKRLWTLVHGRWVSRANWPIDANGCLFKANKIASSQSSNSMLNSEKWSRIGGGQSRFSEVTCYRRIADSWLPPHQAWLQGRHGSRLPTIPSHPGELQDDWSLVHFPNASEFLSLTSSSMEKLIWGLTDMNMNIFFCHFTRSDPAWKILIRKLLTRIPVLRYSRVVRHSIEGRVDNWDMCSENEISTRVHCRVWLGLRWMLTNSPRPVVDRSHCPAKIRWNSRISNIDLRLGTRWLSFTSIYSAVCDITTCEINSRRLDRNHLYVLADPNWAHSSVKHRRSPQSQTPQNLEKWPCEDNPLFWRRYKVAQGQRFEL